MVKDEITKILVKLTETNEINLETPENEAFGDYSSNVALQNESRITNHESPRERAEKIVKKLESDKKLMKLVDHIEVAGPGFINFFLSEKALTEEFRRISEEKEAYGLSKLGEGKTVVIDYSSPNIAKRFGIGQ